jgi:parallel beta-helix repeat protein
VDTVTQQTGIRTSVHSWRLAARWGWRHETDSRAVGRPSRSTSRVERLRALGALVLLTALLAVCVDGGVAYAQTPPSSGVAVCGSESLNSPYSYDGAAGPYTSGTPGLPTFGEPGSDYPNATAGVVLKGSHYYAGWELQPDTVYYIVPGVHRSRFQADAGDVLVGGFAAGKPTVLSGHYNDGTFAIDSNSSAGDQAGVTIEYLTIERFTPSADAAAVNQDTNTDWTIRHDTVRQNVPGAGVLLGSEDSLADDCLTENGQYGFQAALTDPWGEDALTDGPYDLTVVGNEISRNDTCDFSGLLNNAAIGWTNYDPVPRKLRNKHCTPVTPEGDQGGFKLWRTDGVTVSGNYIHENWGPGAWADTDNANTTITDNYISDNEGPAVIEEISYNFSVSDNTIVENDITDGLANPGFPQPAVYISESGSDNLFGGIAACSEAACNGQASYPTQSLVTGNVMTDNGGNVFLWQDSNRSCEDGYDDGCPLVDGGSNGPFSTEGCDANYESASIDTSTYRGNLTGSPQEDWWDGCQWKTANVAVTDNTIRYQPSKIKDCNSTDWPDCGAGGIFADYASLAPYALQGGWVVPSSLTFHQNDLWADNTYEGPSPFFAWNQGNGENPVSWAAWTGALSAGDECESESERQSGFCVGPFGQDTGSTYEGIPAQSVRASSRTSQHHHA